MSMLQCLGHGLVEVRIGEVGLDTLQKPVERRCICDVGGVRIFLRLASTTSEVTPNTSLAVNDYGTGVTWGRECEGLLVVRKNCPPHRHLVRAIWEVIVHERLGAGSAANGHACSTTTLGYMEEQFVVVVAHLREAMPWSGKRRSVE